MTRTIFSYCIILISILLFSCKDSDKIPGRPNLVLIMADDMGYSDIGCFGSEIHTPSLDRLANEGLRITQFYNAARCCPTRAALLTGLYPHQAGIGDMESNWGVPSYQGYLNNHCITLAEGLKMAGYATYMSGKWHVGREEEQWPRKRGFDRYFGLIDGASSYFDIKQYRHSEKERHPFKIMASDDERYFPPDSDFYMTDAFTDHAIEFLQYHSATNPDKPFFLYLPFTAPHWPLHAPDSEIEKYRGNYAGGWKKLRENRYERMKKMGLFKNNWSLSPLYVSMIPDWEDLSEAEKQTWELRMAVYAAMIDRMDQNIGRVLQQLKNMGASDNTLVIFIADNGGCHEEIFRSANFVRDSTVSIGNPGSFDAYGYPWANVSNTPFQLFKHWTMEGGISTPFIAWWPDKIKAGKISHGTGHIIDIMPTFLDLADIEYPEKYNNNTLVPCQGQSLLPLLTGMGNYPERILYWEHEGSKAMRKGNWKIVSSPHPGNQFDKTWMLFDLDKDRTELFDVRNEYPDVFQAMIHMYRQWEKTAGVLDYDSLRQSMSNK